MKWIKRKLRKWVQEADQDFAKSDIDNIITSGEDRYQPDVDPILNFRIYNAENGQILEFNRYDHVKDRRYHSMYIIGKDEEVSEKVAKCLSLEMLK